MPKLANSDVNSVKLEEGDAIFAVSLPTDYADDGANIAVTETPSQRMHTPQMSDPCLPSFCHIT